MHTTGLCFASSSLGDGDCICEGGGSVLLFTIHNWDLFPPSEDSPSPPSLSPGPKGDCLKRDKAGLVAGMQMNPMSRARLREKDNWTGRN